MVNRAAETFRIAAQTLNGEQYVEPGIDAYEQHYRERTLKNLQRKAEALGCKIVPHAEISEGVS